MGKGRNVVVRAEEPGSYTKIELLVSRSEGPEQPHTFANRPNGNNEIVHKK